MRNMKDMPALQIALAIENIKRSNSSSTWKTIDELRTALQAMLDVDASSEDAIVVHANAKALLATFHKPLPKRK